MSLASSIALIAVLAVALGSLPGIVFVFTYAPSFKWRALESRQGTGGRSKLGAQPPLTLPHPTPES